MTTQKSVYQPNSALVKNAYVSSFAQYKQMYQKSLDDPDGFWGEIVKQFHWETPIDDANFFKYNFDITQGPIFVKMFNEATTNIAYNVLDRNIINGHGDRVAYYW